MSLLRISPEIRYRLSVTLAAFLVLYGVAKITGQQLSNQPLHKRVEDLTPAGLVWYFYGYSHIYAAFLGACQIVCAAFLLLRRTMTLGACMALPIFVNITVMDFCFHFPPVKYLALALTLLTLTIILSDWERIKSVFWETPPPAAVSETSP